MQCAFCASLLDWHSTGNVLEANISSWEVFKGTTQGDTLHTGQKNKSPPEYISQMYSAIYVVLVPVYVFMFVM